MDQPRAAEMPAREFLTGIADPSVFSGGGSVAAIAAAGAASTALLVMRLNAKRRRNAVHLEPIQAGIDRLTRLIDELLDAADDDIATLQRLLHAQRERKSSGDEHQYRAVLRDAAAGPIVIAELANQILDAIIPQLDITTRFTISDLGAAAVLAEGAARAALLTSEVNIALLRDLEAPPLDAIQELEQRSNTARRSAVELAERIERASREMIQGTTLAREPLSQDVAP